MSRRHYGVVTSCAILALLGAACGRTANPQGGTPATAAPAATIDVATVVSQPLAMIVPLPGELRPFESVAVYSKVAGFVKSIEVDRGSKVKQSEIIARLDAPELAAQRAEADAKVQASQAQLAAAQAKLASDDGTLSRLKAASATAGVVAGNDLDVAARAVEADRAQVTAQQQAVSAAMQARTSVSQIADYLDVRAPFDGVVTERNVHPGALVGAGSAGGAEPLVRIEMQTTLRLIVPVPETYAAGVTNGRRVEFSVASYPGRSFSGGVTRIAHSVDARTRTMPVEIAVSNATGELTPGAFCEVRWPVERPAPTLFVPFTSVTSTLERTFVVRIRAGKAEWVDVKRGASSGKLVEVFGDVRAGDQVAVRGTDELREGSAVTAHVVEIK
jgi:RND family efflux transporter MFP subunit